MFFAINYSPQAAALLREGRIHIDRFKCPDWPDLIAEAAALCPPYVHFPLAVGRGPISALDKIAALREQTATPFVNTHFLPQDRHTGVDRDARGPQAEERLVAAALEDLRPLIERFGAERVTVENAPYHASYEADVPALAHYPQVLRHVVEQAGCGFLLDLGHALISARHLGMDETDYLNTLPVEHIRELHITGLVQQPETEEWHDHFELFAADWERLEWALEQMRTGRWARPELMAFEYGGVGPIFDWRSETRVIAEQVPRLYALAHSVPEAV